MFKIHLAEEASKHLAEGASKHLVEASKHLAEGASKRLSWASRSTVRRELCAEGAVRGGICTAPHEGAALHPAGAIKRSLTQPASFARQTPTAVVAMADAKPSTATAAEEAKPDAKTVQVLRDMANRLRIHSIRATCTSSSG